MQLKFRHRVFGLDLIRAVAILLVMISHSTILLFPEDQSTSISIIQFFGTIGVDLFFVLSGYLIGGIILKQLETNQTRFKHLFHFWLRRWFRTLPNYFLILVINIILFYSFFDGSIPELASYPLFLQNFDSAHPEFFTEAWSLSIEEYSYILGPFLLFSLLFFLRNTSKKKLFLLASLTMVIIGFLLRLRFHMEHSTDIDVQWSQQIRKVVIYRLDAIYYGFFAVYLSRYFHSFWNRIQNVTAISGVLFFFGMHFILFTYNLLPDNASLFYNVFYLPLLALSLLLFFPKASLMKNRWICSKLITKISLWSYALYLVNFSIVLLSIQHIINVEALSIYMKLAVLVAYWASSFVLAYLLYRFYERPTTNLRDKPSVKSLV